MKNIILAIALVFLLPMVTVSASENSLFPDPELTRIIITSPNPDIVYHVGQEIEIKYTTLLKDSDFIFKKYVVTLDGKRNEIKTTWKPTGEGEYGIEVVAKGKGNGFFFSTSIPCVVE